MSYYVLPELPYARNALEPQISEETINYHYGMHHQTYTCIVKGLINSYVNNLNKLVPEGGIPLEDLIKTAEGGVFNNAAQVWNHSFYWNVPSSFLAIVKHSVCVLTVASLKTVL